MKDTYVILYSSDSSLTGKRHEADAHGTGYARAT